MAREGVGPTLRGNARGSSGVILAGLERYSTLKFDHLEAMVEVESHSWTVGNTYT